MRLQAGGLSTKQKGRIVHTCVCALINSGMYFSFVCMYLCMAVCIHGCMGGLQDLGMDVRECVCLHAYIQIDIVRQTYGYICR